MAIPKIIHYCWFGGNKKSLQTLRFIESFKTKLPDYQIIEWNESNFDVNQHPWMKESYDLKKYGFSSDYFRYKTLYEYGGIYLDTDVLVKKSFNDLLDNDLFMGFMNDAALATAVIGASKNNPNIKKILSLFDNGKAIIGVPSNDWITEFFLENYDDFILNGKEQILKSNIHIFPKIYFDRPTHSKKKGYAVHYYDGSWYNRKNRKYRVFLKKILGEVISSKISHYSSLRNAKFYEKYKEDKKK
ncbi:hypothetical protein LJC17_02365 [Acholeplasma sp. OttesenSCG-928-E16]|nr:hypothetical protein [Acholeplasma sp. OttesenSCG-928-E16]